MRSAKHWIISFILLFLLVLIGIGSFVVYVDPYFHYHKPIPNLFYKLDNERYQNNGIVKNFDYDAIITGSSMTECFHPSELNELFGVNAIKVPFSGGSYKEVNDNLKVAVAHNENIKMIVRCLDANRFFNSKDDVDYTDYPTYLYDENPFNDVSYLYNKSVLLEARSIVKDGRLKGKSTLSFDDYADWNNYYTYGKEAVDAHYNRDQVECSEMLPITDDDYIKIQENIEQNVISLARENPDIEFYLYISPYNIYYMDYWYLTGELERQLYAEKFIIELLLPYENIHLFSFFTEFDTITNLSIYKDVAHSNGELNSQILRWIHDGTGELTAENYEEYCATVWDYYMNYNYDALFESTLSFVPVKGYSQDICVSV